MAKFFLICGISGGGKTILANKVMANNPHLKLFNPDEYYRRINGDEILHENFFPVWHTMWQELHDAEMAGQDVLVDSNALTVQQRCQFLEWFPTFEHHLIWVMAPKEICIEGNNNRRRHVPMDKLMAQWDRMEFPNGNEPGWKTVTHLTNLWSGEYIVYKLKGDIDNYLNF